MAVLHQKSEAIIRGARMLRTALGPAIAGFLEERLARKFLGTCFLFQFQNIFLHVARRLQNLNPTFLIQGQGHIAFVHQLLQVILN